MKKFSVIAVFGLLNLLTTGLLAYSGGDGTAENPYQIANLADLMALRDVNVSSDDHFILTDDIDIHPDILKANGYGDNPDGSFNRAFYEGEFNGTLEGDGHIISNLTIISDGEACFIHEVNGSVFRVGLADINFSGNMDESAPFVYANQGIIEQCFCTGQIDSTGYGNCSFAWGIGPNAQIKNCYSTVDILHDAIGFCDLNSGKMLNCYYSGNTSGNAFGYDHYNDTIENCIWNCELAPNFPFSESNYPYNFSNLRALTSHQFYNPHNFIDIGWDFITSESYGAGAWVAIDGQMPQLAAFHYCRIPDVIGCDLPETCDLIEQAGLTVGSIHHVNSLFGMFNTAIGLSYSIGGHCPPGQPVDIYISIGNNGDGSNEMPFPIACQMDLELIGMMPAIFDRNFIMTADIVFDADKIFCGAIITDETPGQQYNSYEEQGFTGHFNGNGHVIRNMQIDTGKIVDYENPRQQYSNIGLFGKSTGMIENLGIENAHIKLNYQSQESYFYANAVIAGLLCSNNAGTIKQCYTTGKIELMDAIYYNNYRYSIAGLCGFSLAIDYTPQISDCYSVCNIIDTSDSSNDNRIAGFVAASSSQIEHCYSWGTTSSYNAQRAAFCLDNYGEINDCHFGYHSGNDNGIAFPITPQALTTFSENTNWIITNGYLPRPNQHVNNQAPKIPFYGAGTAENPFIIDSVEALTYAGKCPGLWENNFMLTSDIDLGSWYFDRAVIAPDTALHESDFQGTPFSGCFDGNGHAINNLTFNIIFRNDFEKHYSHLALFGGIVNSGVVKNIAMSNNSYNIKLENTAPPQHIAGICGQNAGTIQNCFVKMNMYIDYYIDGGDSGINPKYLAAICGENSGTIANCYASTFIDCSLPEWENTAGSICGKNTGTVNGCKSCAYGNYHDEIMLTLSEMQDPASFPGWDTEIWQLDPGYGPKLKNQNDHGIHIPLDGRGTQQEPFLINDIDCLFAFRTEKLLWNRCFRLTSDIDLAGHTFQKAFIASGLFMYGNTNTAYPFAGKFDGDGHIIDNFTINLDDNKSVSHSYFEPLGFFGIINFCQYDFNITNFGLTNINYIYNGKNYEIIGGLCAISGNPPNAGNAGEIIIRNCYVTGTITINSPTCFVGAFCHTINENIIENCFSNVTIDINSKDGFAAGFARYTGGIYRNSIQNCYASGTINAVSPGITIAGFISHNTKTIENCYAAVELNVPPENENAHGFCPPDSGTVLQCAWDSDVAGVATASAGMALTTAELQDSTSFTGSDWDFGSDDGTPPVWKFRSDKPAYPLLAWQFPAGDINDNMKVELGDFAALSQEWLGDSSILPQCDLNGDELIDINDMAILCQNWLANGIFVQ
ncbi:MAG: hypothetical protein JEZ07_01595 [Phycisphaerae bacterium]|nr:hypothetical protein [Phycisphaerae bacterium]